MLNRIKVKNFKVFKSLDYKCARLNLLIGVNGSGKSSLVQLFRILKAISAKSNPDTSSGENGSQKGFPEFGFLGKYDDIKYCYGKDGEDINVEVDVSIRNCGNRTAETVNLVIKPGIGNSIKALYPLVERTSLSKQIRAIDGAKMSFDSFLKGHNLFAESFKGFRDLKMISAFRIKPRAVHDVGYGTDCFNPEGEDTVAYLYRDGKRFSLKPSNPMRHESTKSGEESFLIDQVNTWLGEISPGVKINIKSDNVGDMQKFIESVDYGDGELRRTFHPQNVGFGVSYILPVLITLLTAQPDDIVIIENPEVYLHPRGQSEMGRLLACAAASGVQLFVETHSDHVIGGIQIAVKNGLIRHDDVNVAFFERKEHNMNDGSVEIFTDVRNIKIDSNGSFNEYPEDFLDEWDRQMKELKKQEF